MAEIDQWQLIDVQKLQFSDKDAAERAMLAFLKEHEDSAIAKVELNPKPESLNSINGFITYINGERYFFKTHVEESEKISEYYNAEALANAGYPVVSARRVKNRVGSQIALYEILSFPTLFDLTKMEEDRSQCNSKGFGAASYSSSLARTLVEEQIKLDKRVFEIYSQTLEPIEAREHSKAPIHQLFSHRLADDGRLGLFYKGNRLQLDTQQSAASSISFDELSRLHWRINGVLYEESLQQIIEKARMFLAPQAGASIIGHGDAHNGNVFFNEAASDKFYLFDPAFAGRHNPLLDLVKPLFHNVFARWMYYPQQVIDEIDLSFRLVENEIQVHHSFFPSEIRIQYLRSKIENLLSPLLDLLRSRGLLPEHWREYMRSALACCPLLTVNLFAPYIPEGTLAERYKLPVKMLGLATTIQFGASGHPEHPEHPKHKSCDDLSELIESIFIGETNDG